MSRNGKIARLPAPLREQINHRIQNGENGRHIIAWLNSLDEVKTVLSQHFKHPEINDGNFSEWKLAGYSDWEAQQFALAESRRIMEEGTQLAETGQGGLANHLATWIVGQYIVATRKIREKMDSGDDEGAWKLLRAMCHDVVALRRGDHGAEWLRLEQERLELQRQKQQSEPGKPRDTVLNPPLPSLSDEEKEQQWAHIFGFDRESHPMCGKRNPFAPAQGCPDLAAPPPEKASSENTSPPSSVPLVPSVPSPKECPEAHELQRLTELAEKGDAYSAYCLGVRYRDGFVVAKNLRKAREWLEKAALQGIGGAKIELNALLRRWDPDARQAFDLPD